MSISKEQLFKNRLLKARKLRKLNQEELAEKADIPSTTISHFESDTRKPSFDNLRKLADALEVSIDYLMGRTASISGGHAQQAEIFRDYENLTDNDRVLAREFMASLAKRNTND